MTDLFAKNKPILARDLNTTHRLAQRGSALPAAPGASAAGVDQPMATGIYVSIIARAIDAPAALSSHGYTLIIPSPGGGGGNTITADWNHLIVRSTYGLVDPQADKNMTFAPAAVVGDAEWTAQPWRAWGILHRFAGVEPDQNPAWGVELFGIAPVFGCG